jgi:glycosyltransferase involved in cell wall biosynthesis
MSDRRVSIIAPAFNEEGNLLAAVEGVLRAAASANLDAYEVIIVDDGSTDNTAGMARLLQLRWSAVTQVISHPTNLGLRAAYETGLAAAEYPYIAWFPGDGEMATESIAAILTAVGTADLVIPYHGTPERRTWFRRLLTWGSTTEMNVLLGHRLHYYQGPVIYPTTLARSLPRTVDGFFFAAESLAWALEDHPSYVEVPLIHIERQYGASNAVGWPRIWAAQKLIVRLWYRITVARMSRQAEHAFQEAPHG